MQEVTLGKPNEITESEIRINPSAKVYCPNCGKRMKVKYNKNYGGELWTCRKKCGYSTDHASNGHDWISAENLPLDKFVFKNNSGVSVMVTIKPMVDSGSYE